MQNYLNVLDTLNKLLNGDDYEKDSVYDGVVKSLFVAIREIENSTCAMCFIENSNYVLKSGFRNGKKLTSIDIDNKIVNKLFSSKSSYVKINTLKGNNLFSNSILIKLSIRKSVFGFVLVSCENDLDDIQISELTTLCSAISYKIKDYELNQVFKMQLKAMQDAVIEKMEAYKLIEKQHKKLQELDKTKNLFLANISHELRTPLNAIIGFSQALDSKIFGELNDKQAEYIKDIQISSLHLLGMINEILDISKLEANAMKYSPSNIYIEQVIQEVINILEPLYKRKNITVDFKSEYSGQIFADYQKMQQILYNLLSNAIKFTGDNGEIKIKSYTKDNNYYLIVADNGIGIDKKYHNKIFKKFVHLNNVYAKSQSSTGLGLTITKELVKLHKGKISLQSELNKGTTFEMEFKNILV